VYNIDSTFTKGEIQMDETINKEPVLSEAGEVGANRSPSAAPGTVPSAIDEDSLKGILGPLVEAEVERRTQSVKDKRIAKQESRISSLEDTLVELKALQSEGMSEKQAIQYMKMQELLASQSPQPTSPAQELAAQPQVTVDDYLSPLLQAIGLADTDAGVIEIVRKESDPAKRQIAIAELAIARKQVEQEPGNPAAVLPEGGGKASEGDTLESVSAELNKLQFEPATPANRKRIQELSKKHKELLPKR